VQHSVRDTLIFAFLLCVSCAIVVSSVAVALRERQAENKLLDEQKNVSSAASPRTWSRASWSSRRARRPRASIP
jgi:Na+-transporting NADH:ubiquinone oxidoreductase subunit NqrC